MKASLLPDRCIVRFSGDDAGTFLNGLLTANIAALPPGGACYAALLTPQGKIILDMIVSAAPAERGEAFCFDIPKSRREPFLARMRAYDLRGKYAVEDLGGTHAVMAVWGGAGRDGTAAPSHRPCHQDADHQDPCHQDLCHQDPRLAALGQRMIVPPGEAGAAAARIGAELVPPDAYEAHRIALGIPRGDVDFAYADAFPHEADMDQLHGVDFQKGCFVGQEVVQRMERRNSARTRVVCVTVEGGAPASGAEVTAGGKTIGTMGSAAGRRGLALLRLDRAADALGAGHPLRAGEATLRLVKPDWVRFAVPDEGGAPQEPEARKQETPEQTL